MPILATTSSKSSLFAGISLKTSCDGDDDEEATYEKISESSRKK